MSEEKKQSSKETQYFKVDKKILDISDRALSGKAVKVYLFHCRRINPKKNLGCSLAGYNDAAKMIGIHDRKVYKKAIEELKEKHLIAERPDVKTGYLKTTAIEVLAFPDYDPKLRRFKPNKTREHQHRTYSNQGEYLLLPAVLIDNGHFKALSPDAILLLLRLYGAYDREYHCIDFRKLYGYHKDSQGNITPGYKVFTDNCSMAEAENMNWRTYKNISLNWEILNDIERQGLLERKLAIIYRDPNDEDYQYIERVIKPDADGKNYFQTPGKGFEVIGIYTLTYSVESFFAEKAEST